MAVSLWDARPSAVRQRRQALIKPSTYYNLPLDGARRPLSPWQLLRVKHALKTRKTRVIYVAPSGRVKNALRN